MLHHITNLDTEKNTQFESSSNQFPTSRSDTLLDPVLERPYRMNENGIASFTYSFPDESTLEKITKLTSFNAKFSSLAISWPWLFSNHFLFPIQSENVKELFRTGWQQWESIGNFTAHEMANASYPIYIANSKLWLQAAGVANVIDHSWGAILLQKNLFQGRYAMSIDEMRETAVHEIGHILGLNHPFVASKRLRNEEFRSFSIMSYNFESYYDKNGDIRYIMAATPMPNDILAIHQLYGKNITTGFGDNTHYLDEYMFENNKYDIISAIYDPSGTNTLSAEKHDGEVTINLRRGPFHRSAIHHRDHTSWVTLSYDTNISHAIGGKDKNVFVANELPNTFDARESIETTVILDPKNTGHDEIIGFNATRDSLILQAEPGDLPITYHITNDVITGDVQIIFDNQNSITLKNVTSIQVNSEMIKTIVDPNLIYDRHPELTRVVNRLTFDFLTYCSEVLAKDFKAAWAKGIPLGFITAMTSDVLSKRYHCSNETIAYIHQMLYILTTLMSGSYISTGSGLLTNCIMRHLGYSRSACTAAAVAVSTGTSLLQNFSMFGAARIMSSVIGSNVGWVIGSSAYSALASPLFQKISHQFTTKKPPIALEESDKNILKIA